MRILALNWRDIGSPEAGGAEVHLHEILSRLVVRGHEATLVCSQFAKGKGAASENIDGVLVRRTGAWWDAHLTVPRLARRLLRVEKFDLVLDTVNKIPFFAPRWSAVPTVALFHHLMGDSMFMETNFLLGSVIRRYERRVGKV